MSDKRSSSEFDDPASAEEEVEEQSMTKRMPEGMRVVRKRRKKRDGARQTLFLKKREILREMHDEGGVVGVKEQVERLKSAKKSKEQTKPLEDRWGGPKSKQKGGRWFLLRVFALLIPVLAIVTGFMLMKGEKGRELMEGYDPKLNLGPEDEPPVYDPEGPIGWFYDNPHTAYTSAFQILSRLNEAIGEDGAVAEDFPPDLLRDQETALRRIAESGSGWSSKFLTGDQVGLKWWTERSDQIGYLIVTGWHADQSTYHCYFVKTPDGLRMDWEASTGWCEVPIKDLVERQPEKPVLVRCVLAKETNYDIKAGAGSLRSWYLVRTKDNSAHVWAYVPDGSALDRKLLRKFRFGMMVLERKSDVRAVLRLTKPLGDFQPNEFEITELVTEQWVMPDEPGQ